MSTPSSPTAFAALPDLRPSPTKGPFRVCVDDGIVSTPAFVATASSLPLDSQVLLSIPAIRHLGILLDEQKRGQCAPLVCHLGGKSLRACWDCHEGESVDAKPFDPNDIDINPNTPQCIIDRATRAFEGNNNTLPKPFDAPPVELKFKPDASPQSVPEPRWSYRYAYGKILRKWAEDGLKNLPLKMSQSA
jgi:hypothetical protein